MNHVKAGLYNPGDGHVDPYSLTQALAIGARLYGAVVRQGTSVTALTQTESGGWTVDTADGQRLQAARVVNAAGLWAREIGQLTGLDLPLVPVHHQVCLASSYSKNSPSSSSFLTSRCQQQQQQTVLHAVE